MLLQYRRGLHLLFACFLGGVLRESPPFAVARFAVLVAAGMVGIVWVGSRAAMDALTAPITVSCPECGGDYLLQGYVINILFSFSSALVSALLHLILHIFALVRSLDCPDCAMARKNQNTRSFFCFTKKHRFTKTFFCCLLL